MFSSISPSLVQFLLSSSQSISALRILITIAKDYKHSGPYSGGSIFHDDRHVNCLFCHCATCVASYSRSDVVAELELRWPLSWIAIVDYTIGPLLIGLHHSGLLGCAAWPSRDGVGSTETESALIHPKIKILKQSENYFSHAQGEFKTRNNKRRRIHRINLGLISGFFNKYLMATSILRQHDQRTQLFLSRDGWPTLALWPRTAPNDELDASHISSNGRSQFGACKIGADVSRRFSSWNALVQGWSNLNSTFFCSSLGKLAEVFDEPSVKACMSQERANIQHRSGELWHKRLGHMSEKGLEILAKDHLQSIKGQPFDLCEDCLVGKQHKVSFHRPDSGRRRKHILDLVHSDVCSTSERSLGGAQYFVTFIDDHSRKLWVYPLKRKDEVLRAFKEFHASVERETGKKLKCLRSDN
ncbi:hypothetical protein CR513_51366, partial [Mucuna pruriens]